MPFMKNSGKLSSRGQCKEECPGTDFPATPATPVSPSKIAEAAVALEKKIANKSQKTYRRSRRLTYEDY